VPIIQKEVNPKNILRLLLFSSHYEITKHSHIIKQDFAKTLNSMIFTHEANREKVRWVDSGEQAISFELAGNFRRQNTLSRLT
jgi:hypothetical protein